MTAMAKGVLANFQATAPLRRPSSEITRICALESSLHRVTALLHRRSDKLLDKYYCSNENHLS
jgi:hypothetical protein